MATNKANFDIMMARLGARSSPTLRAFLIPEVNKAIRELERGATKPWFMEDRLEGTLVANQDYILQPATFLSEVEEGSFRTYHADRPKWCALKKVDYDQLQRESENCEAGDPRYYALRGTRVYFGAAPSKEYSYRWEAYVRTGEIADNTVEASNPWILEFFDFVSLKALDKIARLYIRSAEIIDSIAQPFATAQDNFWRDCEARQQANRDYEQQPGD